MRKLSKTQLSFFAAGLFAFAPVAGAAPMGSSGAVTAKRVAGSLANVETVQFRHRHWHRGHRWHRGHHRHHGRHRYGRWWGPGIAAGLIIGGSIAAARSNHRDRWEDCDATYRSFRWSDGTFQPYGGGPRQLCPYLRG